MVKMLRHKQTGELFIYTSLLAGNNTLEPVVEDPVQGVLDELKNAPAEAPVESAGDSLADALVAEMSSQPASQKAKKAGK